MVPAHKHTDGMTEGTAPASGTVRKNKPTSCGKRRNDAGGAGITRRSTQRAAAEELERWQKMPSQAAAVGRVLAWPYIHLLTCVSNKRQNAPAGADASSCGITRATGDCALILTPGATAGMLNDDRAATHPAARNGASERHSCGARARRAELRTPCPSAFLTATRNKQHRATPRHGVRASTLDNLRHVA